ncbi:hypothetical protein KR067_011053 [Drosophila pandora]|nr:hypothetical protein KR067_011053 [Drosophila pandora]
MELVVRNRMEDIKKRNNTTFAGVSFDVVHVPDAPEVEPSPIPGESLEQFPIEFPLADHTDPSLCRDAFMKDLLKEHDRKSAFLRLSTRKTTGIEEVEDKQTLIARPTMAALNPIEILAMQQLARKFRGSTKRKTVEEIIERIRERQSALLHLRLDCQMASIDYLTKILTKQLSLFSDPLPGNVEDIPFNLFRWSLEYFEARLNVKQIYLDVIQRERTKDELNCIKFRTDLSEITSFANAILKQFHEKEDLCGGVTATLR